METFIAEMYENCLLLKKKLNLRSKNCRELTSHFMTGRMVADPQSELISWYHVNVFSTTQSDV